MTMIPVLTVQKGLAVFAARAGTQGPGAVDGVWGPNTLASMRAFWARAGAGEFATMDGRAMSQEVGWPIPPVGAREMEMHETVARKLTDLAAAYRAPAGSTPSPTPTTPTVPPLVARSASSSTGSVVAGLLVGGLVVGGLAWWLLKD